MVTKLNHNSPIPLHHQLTEIIRKELMNGNFVDSNGKLPTEYELAEQFQVSRVTVRTALNTLLNEGLLDRKRGSGTFLKSNLSENWIGQLMGFSESIEAAGVKSGAEVLRAGTVTNVADRVQEELQSSEAWELRRLRFADGEPIAIEHSYFQHEIGLELAKQQDLKRMKTYEFIERKLNIKLHQAKQVMSAVNANREEAELLHVAEGDALLYIERCTVSIQGKPIEFLQSVYRPDDYQYVIHLHRKS